ncbi:MULTISPECIES: hypothetical protein [unclassified Cyanobium]|jgi:hypothetical protein|uniref:hypothetical protein n=1 Tax=unclassified Cyanobium TaxID=2627006 RepID=UPI0020CD5032|nr:MULTISPECIES: hypothetical protein [unclassified Cyanobium]MCP9899561.1 hypothetical protein [Cyanobium sp. Cruz CV11-17]
MLLLDTNILIDVLRGSANAMASRFPMRSSWPRPAAPISASPPATAAISRWRLAGCCILTSSESW